MKKLFRKLMILAILSGILLTNILSASAYTAGDPWKPDLRAFLQDPVKREYVEMMVDHYIRTDKDIRNALEGGFAAMFLFDGCSDNLNDPELSDLSYYRVSGVCIVVRQDPSGNLKLVDRKSVV